MLLVVNGISAGENATENHAAGEILYPTSIMKKNSKQPKTNLEADGRPVKSAHMNRIFAVPNIDRENPGVMTSAISAVPPTSREPDAFA